MRTSRFRCSRSGDVFFKRITNSGILRCKFVEMFINIPQSQLRNLIFRITFIERQNIVQAEKLLCVENKEFLLLLHRLLHIGSAYFSFR